MRRRQPDRPEGPRRVAPLWAQNLSAGLRYAQELTGKRDLRDLYPVLRREQARWCAENGCHRPGTKTCREVFGRVPQHCQNAGGPAEQGEG